MLSKEKITSVVLLVLLVITGLTGYLFYNRENTQKQELQRQLDELNRTQSSTKAALDKARDEARGLGQKLQEAENNIATLSDELENESLARREVMAQLDQVRNELQKQVYQRFDLEQQLNKSRQDMNNLQVELDRLQAIKSDLEAKIKDVEAKVVGPTQQNVELGQIVVTPQPEEQAAAFVSQEEAAAKTKSTKPPVLKGSVLVLNTEHDFAVINLGSNDGLNPDDTLAVYEGGRFIGYVKIEKTQESMCAVNFLSSRVKSKLSAGKEYNFKVK